MEGNDSGCKVFIYDRSIRSVCLARDMARDSDALGSVIDDWVAGDSAYLVLHFDGAKTWKPLTLALGVSLHDVLDCITSGVGGRAKTQLFAMLDDGAMAMAMQEWWVRSGGAALN